MSLLILNGNLIMRKTKKEINKKLTKLFLIKEYIKNKKNIYQIAQEINYSKTVIWRHLKKHNILIRNNSESKKGTHMGKNHWRFKGRVKTTAGYIMLYMPQHPNAVNGGCYIAEHRLAMEKKLDRYLKSEEVVHHINGIKDDNRPENLALTDKYNHNTHSLIQQLQERIRDLEYNA